MMRPRLDEEPDYDTDDEWPMVVLRTHNSFQRSKNARPPVLPRVVDYSPSETLNAITQG